MKATRNIKCIHVDVIRKQNRNHIKLARIRLLIPLKSDSGNFNTLLKKKLEKELA